MEDDFPYVASDVPCDCPYPHEYLIDDWVYIGEWIVPPVDSIKQAIVDYGPVSAAVYANSAMQAYTGGVFNGCGSGDVNHAVVLVGWDDSQGSDGIWFMRNSWGTGWGESGYMRIPYVCSSIGYHSCYVDYPGALPLKIYLRYDLPEVVPPGEFTLLEVYIEEVTDSYVLGTGQIHYRYDDGAWLTGLLEPLGGDLYQATLPPAMCDDTPEFYFSAQSAASGPVYAPPEAPDVTYSMGVGEIITIFIDDFETDQGWTGETLGATSGDWQRGVPVNDPDWDYDPASDSDGSGQCWLTQNEMGNTDVDDGAVRLTSATIDMSIGGITISYDYFLRLTSTAGGVDLLLVEIDGNNGAGPWIEIARHDTDGGLSWRSHEITQEDLDTAGVTLTSTMRIRFTTNDADPQSINESGLDAFSVFRIECVPPGLVAPLPEDSLGTECTEDAQCEGEARCVSGVCYAPKHRYISIARNLAQTASTARRITLQGTEPPVQWWVGTPYESGGLTLADVVAAPVYVDQWPDVVHVTGCEIATDQTYLIQAIALGEDVGDEGNYSEPSALHTPSVWGDTVSPSLGVVCKPPDGIVGLADIMAAIREFQGVDVAPLTWLDIAPSTGSSVPDQVVGLGDIMGAIGGFQGDPYPGLGPLNCP
jgi:hypothetical protein